MAIESWTTAVTTQSVQLALLTQGSGSPFNAMKAILFQNAYQPLPTTTLAAITVATFDGYAAQAVGTYPTPYIGADQNIHLTWPSINWVMTGNTTPNIINGWGLTNTAGTVWVGGNSTPAPVNMGAINDGLTIVPDIIWGG